MFLPPLSKGEEGRGRIACARFNTKARTNARFSHSCRATCRNSTYYYTEIPYRKRRRRREKEKRVSTKPFPSCASTLADTGCYATHELDAMHSGWACGDFIITSSLPTECIRIEKCAGLFFSYRGYRDNARMPVTRARIHPSFGREREREREIPLVSLTPVTLLLFFPPWISSCARRTVDVRRKGGRRIPLAEGQRQRERERGRSGVIWG